MQTHTIRQIGIELNVVAGPWTILQGGVRFGPFRYARQVGHDLPGLEVLHIAGLVKSLDHVTMVSGKPDFARY